MVGPASRLKGLEQVTTEPISAEGLREPYSRAVRVELDPLVRLDRDTTVEITLQVGEERLLREVSGVVVAGEPESSSVRLEPQTLRVTLGHTDERYTLEEGEPLELVIRGTPQRLAIGSPVHVSR